MKALLIVSACLLVFAVACGGSETTNDPISGGSGDAAPAGESTSSDTGNSSASSLPFDNKLVVTSSVELEVDHLRETYNSVGRTARDLGGFVAESRISDGEDDPTAFLRLRVPAARHDELLAAIRSVGDGGVKYEDTRAVEVTAEYTDLQSSLKNLLATEAQYQQLLDRAESIDEILQVTARLDSVRSDIELVQGRINLLDDKVGFATVTVTLSTPAATGSLAPPLEVLVDALETSLLVAHGALNVLIVLLVAGLWLMPVGVLALLLRKRFRKPLQTFWAWFS